MTKTILCLFIVIICSSFNIQKDPDTKLARRYLNKGYEFLRTASHDSSIFYFQKSADLYFQRELWQKHAESLNNLSTNYYKLGSYDSAIKYANQALKICRDKMNPTDLEASYSYNSLGNINRLMGNFSLALEYYDQSKDIKIKNLGENHIDVTKAYNNMAIAYSMQGNYEKSIMYFRLALKIRQKTLPPDHRLLTNVYNNIGATYWEQGIYDSALFYHHKTLQIRKKTLGDHPLTGNSLNNIGTVYEMQEDYILALKYYQQALEIFQNVFGNRHPLINSTTINIGDVYSKSNQPDKALQYYQNAVIAVSGNFNQTNPIKNPIIENVHNHFDLVIPLFSKAAEFEKKFDSSSDLKYLQHALKNIQKCDTTIIKVRQQQQEDVDKLTLGAKIKTAYEIAMRISLKLYKQTADHNDAGLIFYFAEQSKSSVLLQATSDLSAKNFGDIPIELLEKEKKLKESKGIIKSQMLNDSSSRLKANLFQTKRKHDSLISVFENQFPNYFEHRYRTEIVSLKDVQSHLLKNNQVLIEYFLNDEKLYIIGIDKNKFKISHVHLDSIFDIHYQQFIEAIKNPKTVNQEFEEYTSYTKSAFYLYKTLLAPLEEIIKDKELIIVPDGKLALIPMDALLTNPVVSKNINYQTLDYVLKSHSISYANSSTTLWNNNKSTESINDPINILAFAPSVSEAQSKEDQLSPLNWNTEEVNMLDSYFHTVSYTNSLATEAEFKKKADQFQVIHIASHALIDNKNPLNSKIAFAENTNDPLNDGYLHTFELYNSQINAEMVVLSACNTGTGSVQKGENVMSLGYAFAYAGVPNIMMSHWQIDDKSTYLLMQHFYKNLSKGMKKTDALRNAKLSLMGDSEITYANPYYWGAFVLYGDTNPITKASNIRLYIYSGLLFILVLIIFMIKKFKNSDNL